MSSLLWSAVNAFSPDYRRASRAIADYCRCSPEDAAAESRRLLHHYMRYCLDYSPFWRERWPREWQTFKPEEAEHVLSLLPCLTKDDLRNHLNHLHIHPNQRRPNDGFPPLGRQSIMTSGGSTGAPVKIYTDSRFAAWARASYDFFYRQVGLIPGTPYFFIWGSPNELRDIKNNWRKRFSSWLRGSIPMPAFGLTAEKTHEICRDINGRPSVRSAICFVSAADTLVHFMRHENITIQKLDRMITGGGLLSDTLREQIKQHLAKDVFNLYAARDMNIIAFETPAHDGLSLAMWHSYVEVLDESGRRVPDGAVGQVHISQMRNYSCALLRFASGDTARWHGDPGRNTLPTPRITELRGRLAEHLLGPNGVRVDPAAIIHIVGVILNPPWLKRFQLAQQAADTFELRVESLPPTPDPQQLSALGEGLRQHLSNIVAADVQIRVKLVDEIPPAASGKHLYCTRENKAAAG